MEFQIGQVRIAVKGFNMFRGARSFTIVINAPIGEKELDIKIDYMEGAVDELVINSVLSRTINYET